MKENCLSLRRAPMPLSTLQRWAGAGGVGSPRKHDPEDAQGSPEEGVKSSSQRLWHRQRSQGRKTQEDTIQKLKGSQRGQALSL